MERKELANKICKDFKLKRIWGKVAFIIFLIQFCIGVVPILGYINFENFDISFIIRFFTVPFYVFASIFFLLNNSITKNRVSMNIEDFMENIYKTKSSISEEVLSGIVFFIIVLNPFTVALYAVLMSIYGTYGIASIPTIIGYIYYLIAYIDMKKYNKLLLLPNKLQEKNKKEQEKKIDDAKSLLAKIGKIFFVNYYNELKNFNTLDIIDVIQENYSEDSKKSRITNAKKIFSMNLQIEALNEILENTDGVANQKILDKARILLEKETKVPSAKKIEEKNDCNDEKSHTESQGYIKTITEYFKNKKGLETSIEISPDGDENIVVNYQLKYLWSLCIKIDEDKETIKIYTPFCKINSSKQDNIYEHLSKWNHDFLFIKFFIENTVDGLYIIASNDVPLVDKDSVCDFVFYLADEFIKTIDKHFSDIPQNIIGF